MRIATVAYMTFAIAAFLSPATQAQDHGTKAEAVAMVDAAIGHISTVGREQAFKDFVTPGSKWIAKDLYVFAYEVRGDQMINVAHGANPKLVGKNLADIKSPDGKFVIRDLWDIANTKGAGWYDYQWPNPLTKSIDNKTSYVKRIPGMNGFVAVGVYLPR